MSVVTWAIFQSTPPVRGATPGRGKCRTLPGFQSTPPVRGATLVFRYPQSEQQFQSTPPVRGATTQDETKESDGVISIHAPRAGSDNHGKVLSFPQDDFNPRPPCGERPAVSEVEQPNIIDFNPRPPCGERQQTTTKRHLINCAKLQIIFLLTAIIDLLFIISHLVCPVKTYFIGAKCHIIIRSLGLRTDSNYQRFFWHISCFTPKMFYLIFILFTKIIESQAVFLLIYDR